jgi:peptidoglycan hydrolase-like protein with peptidoglycan-binding domain
VRKEAKRVTRAAAGSSDDTAASRGVSRWFALRALGLSGRDVAGITVGVAATGAVLVNVLLMQTGSHPAPLFQNGIMRLASQETTTASVPAPRARPAEMAQAPAPVSAPAKAEAPAAARSSGEIISDIQRELARRGFYDGSIDGRHGPKTDSAIRDFEHAAGLKASGEVNEALLRTMTRSTATAKTKLAATPTPRPAPNPAPAPAPARSDPIAEVLAPSKRIVAVQRALADFGYGQIKPTGVIDTETKTAIEKFERERRMPVTGHVSDRLARELASLTGRPLE